MMASTQISSADSKFEGSIPELYERHLVPLIFDPYARDMARTIAAFRPGSVLELAAGTGVVTRELARTLAHDASIVATDLNQPMLDQAAKVGTARPVEWRQADAMQLPFADASFDVVACQFGVMFFPDRVKAFGEVKRVLKDGGTFVFNVWDRIEDNLVTHEATVALGKMFPDDPPRFMIRIPHGYHDKALIRSDLERAGFRDISIETKSGISRAPSAEYAATALCQGTPLRSEIEARDASKLQAATDLVAESLRASHGSGACDGKIQAIVIEARR